MSKNVLITGASRGIGAACARRYAMAGYTVIIHYNKSKSKAEALQKELSDKGLSALTLCADLADPNAAEQLVKKAQELVGGIDILINNAGVALNAMFCDTTLEDWNRLFTVNITSMAQITRASLPYMVHQKKGYIVNLSSVWGITGASCEVAYSASKAAVIGFTKALAKELGPSGIFVNCVAPGVIDTDMNADLDEEAIAFLQDETPLGKIGTPEDIAETVFFLGSEANQFTTGQVISPNGGLVI